MLALLALPIAPVAVRVKVLEIEDAPEGGVIVAVGAEVATVIEVETVGLFFPLESIT